MESLAVMVVKLMTQRMLPMVVTVVVAVMESVAMI